MTFSAQTSKTQHNAVVSGAHFTKALLIDLRYGDTHHPVDENVTKYFICAQLEEPLFVEVACICARSEVYAFAERSPQTAWRWMR